MNILNYLLESNLCLLCFMLFYWLVLHKEYDFRLKRFFLLSCLFASFIFPLFSLPDLHLSKVAEMPISNYIISEIPVPSETDSRPSGTTIDVVPFLLWIYFGGVLFFFLRLLKHLLKIAVRLNKGSHYLFLDRFSVMESGEFRGASSFFHYIFLGDLTEISPPEKEKILLHEVAHANCWHSLDKLVLEITHLLFWFNPALPVLKKILTEIHEFEADEIVVGSEDPQNYCSLLARVALQSSGYPLASHFNKSLTLKRIAMLKAEKSKTAGWRIALIFPAMCALFLAVSCQDQVISDLSESTLSQTMDYPEQVKSDLLVHQAKFPDGKFTYLEGEENDIRKLLEQYAGKMIVRTYSYEDRGMIGILLQDLPELKNEQGVYNYVDKPAEFPGGMAAFYNFVREHFRYHKELEEKKTDERIFVNFTVNTNGSLSDIRLIQGVDNEALNDEALRIMKLSPNWKPAQHQGQVVKQRMVLPVVFFGTLSSTAGSTKAETSEDFQAGSIVVEDLRKEHLNGKTILHGTVKNMEGEPLPGMNILIRNTTVGTVASLDGSFQIASEQASGDLVFSFVGYNTRLVQF